MKRARLVALIILALSCPATADAQHRTNSKSAVVPAFPVKVEYDQSDNRTSVALWQMPVPVDRIQNSAEQSSGDFLTLTLVDVYNGKVRESASPFVLVTVNCKEALANTEAPALILMVDDSRLSFVTEWWDFYENELKKKHVQFNLPTYALEQLAYAHKVTAKLGSVEFHLSNDNFAAFREFAAKIKPIKSADSSPVVRTQEESGVQTKYDRFEDLTTMWTRFENLYIENPLFSFEYLQLTGYFTHLGKGAGHPIRALGFIFESRSREWIYLKDSTLNAIVDGERVPLGRPRGRDSDVLHDDGVHERLVFNVPYSTMKKIAYARNVEMRLGPSEFKLRGNFLAELQTLLSKIKTLPRVNPLKKGI